MMVNSNGKYVWDFFRKDADLRKKGKVLVQGDCLLC